MALDNASSQNELPPVGPDTQALAEAFCLWRLPRSVCPDPCATDLHYLFPRFGSNLLSLDEAKAMFDHLVEQGLLRIAPTQTDGDEDPREALLAMGIAAGKLVISIGVEALANAIEDGPVCAVGAVVIDPDAFAREVLTSLREEDEQGNNLIHRAFDSAAEMAVESGAESIRFPGEEKD